MRIGVPKELKNNEHRVGSTPAGVHELVTRGHEVAVESGAGAGSAMTDEDFENAGATILATADEVWETAELILKVKEPVAEEFHRMRPGQALFTFLHLAASEECTQALLDKQVDSIAYELVRSPNGALPLLFPMSEVAGRLAPLVGTQALMSPAGGPGKLIGGVSGVRPTRVVVIGAGVSGMNAVAVAVGLWADVVLLDKDIDKLRAADRMYQGRIRTVASTAFTLEQEVLEADLVIGCVLIPGSRAPKLVTNDMVRRMKPGSVLVDIAIDQGGCFENSKPTTHDDPTFEVHNSVYYCVANMPGAVPTTSTRALTNATMSYVLKVADQGWREAMKKDTGLARGLNTFDGHVTNANVAEAFNLDFTAPEKVLAD